MLTTSSASEPASGDGVHGASEHALAPAPATTFVGRERELGLLRGMLNDARAGRGGVAFITGEPGIGKTRLAEEFAADARRSGATVVWGRCHEGEGAPAFWPWVQIVRALARGRSARALRAALGSGAADIARLVPEVRERLPGLPESPALAPEQARFRAFDSVSAFVRVAAGARPLVLILDDLHWADMPSLLLLRFLAREIAEARVLALATYRDVEVDRGRPLGATLAGLAQAPGCERLGLRGLTEADVAQVIAALTGAIPPAPLVSLVHQETEGNPFFVAEIVRLLAVGEPPGRPDGVSRSIVIPPSVLDVVNRRLGRVSAGCRQALTLAAVIGREFDLTTLDQIGRGDLTSGPGDGDRLLALVEEAERTHLIAAVPDALGRYSFTHALVREALYEALPASRRMRLHRRAGEALEALGGADVEGRLEQLAHHFVQAAPAGDVDKAIGYARRAGERAVRLLAYEQGARFYQLAVQALALQRSPADEERYDLLLLLGGAEVRAGQADQAREAFHRAAGIARARGWPERLARAALGLELTGLTPGVVHADQVRLLEEALAALGEGGPSTPRGARPALRVRLLARLAMELYYSEERARGVALSQEAVRLARAAADPPALAFALQARRWAAWGPDTIAERLALGVELVALARTLGDHELALAGHHTRFVALQEMGEMDTAAAEADRQARLADELRIPFYQWHLMVYRAMRAILDGRFDEGEELARRALALGQRGDAPNAAPVLALQLALLRWQQGRLTEAEAIVRRAVEQRPALTIWRCMLALLAGELGRLDEARRLFEQMARHQFADLPRDLFWLAGMALLSETCARLGDADRAERLARLLTPYAALTVMTGRAVCLGPVARYLGLLAATRGDWSAAARRLETAQAASARMGARPFVARAQYDYAAMLLGRMQREGGWKADADRSAARATELLGEALVTARELGMSRLSEQAAALQAGAPAVAVAAAAPASLSPRPAVLPGGLTPREAAVLRLLASGESNPEIAAALAISVKTVERHAVNIYAKINARNRVDAAAYALRHGLL
jgi:ATP/maltotriose-dependent transcriptional regulator MalT